MSTNASFDDETGTARLIGSLALDGNIPLSNGSAIVGTDNASGATGGKLSPGDAGATGGGAADMTGGQSPDGTKFGAEITAEGAANAGHGKALVFTSGASGASGQALVSDGANHLVYGGLVIAAGVPAGAPTGLLPIAIDTTAVTGGIYGWNGSAWVKAATI